MPRIVISYRRSDSAAIAGRIFDRLVARYETWSSGRQRRDVHLLRYIPMRSVLHSLWAGTKILAVMALSIALFVWPTWRAEGIVAVLLLAVLLAVRIPAGAVPRTSSEHVCPVPGSRSAPKTVWGVTPMPA